MLAVWHFLKVTFFIAVIVVPIVLFDAATSSDQFYEKKTERDQQYGGKVEKNYRGIYEISDGCCTTYDSSLNGKTDINQFDYYWCDYDTGSVIRVPRGFATDYASVPQFARGIVRVRESSAEPALVHDWLYALGTGASGNEPEELRKFADDVFMRALQVEGVGQVRRWIMYSAVRYRGGRRYGTEMEWAGRWFDPDPPRAPIIPPVIRAEELPVVRTMSCTDFERQVDLIARAYGTGVSDEEAAAALSQLNDGKIFYDDAQ